jgi:hypothetical protein
MLCLSAFHISISRKNENKIKHYVHLHFHSWRLISHPLTRLAREASYSHRGERIRSGGGGQKHNSNHLPLASRKQQQWLASPRSSHSPPPPPPARAASAPPPSPARRGISARAGSSAASTRCVACPFRFGARGAVLTGMPSGFVAREGCSQVEGVSKKRRGIGSSRGAGGSQASSSRRDRGLAIDFKEPQVRGALDCFAFIHKLHNVSVA